MVLRLQFPIKEDTAPAERFSSQRWAPQAEERCLNLDAGWSGNLRISSPR